MATSEDKKTGDKTWNNQQQKGKVNEGFSGENLPEDYNPSKLNKESETDSEGETKAVNRARKSEEQPNTESDEKKLQKQKSEGKEDFNYDDPSRYPSGHPDNKKDHGNEP